MMPLMLADAGTEQLIHKVGGSPEVKKAPGGPGLHPGSTVTLVSAMGGNVIVKVKGVPRGHQRGNGPQDHGLIARQAVIAFEKQKYHIEGEQKHENIA